MSPFPELVVAHPAWAWAAAGAILLTVEALSGSGWLLWPAASAGVVALACGAVRLEPAAQLLIFAVLTLITTAVARRFTPKRSAGEDINDAAARLVGREGRTLTHFDGRAGRVLVDGKEWSAELLGEGPLQVGARVSVTAVAGATLVVRQL